MKAIFAVVFILISQPSWGGSCVTTYPADLLFCNENLSEDFTVYYRDEVEKFPGGTMSKEERRLYIEEAVRLLADKTDDERFDYVTDFEDGSTVLLYPEEGHFEVLPFFKNSEQYVFVHWQDNDDSSYGVLFESSESYEPIYINYEN